MALQLVHDSEGEHSMSTQATALSALTAALAKQRFSGGPLTEEEAKATFGLALPAFAPIKRALAEAGQRPIAIQVLGDSTGNDTWEWPTLVTQHIAAQNPAWTVQTRTWDDATQKYGAPVTVQTGTAGEQYLLAETGKTTRRLSPGAITHITGVMDVRVKLAAVDWSAAGSTTIVGREQGAGQRSWWMQFNATGNPQFVVSSDGTATNTQTCPVPVPFADGATGWVRAVYTPDDGAGNRTCQFYTSTDGQTWTALGSIVTTATAIQPFNAPNATMDLGGRGGAAGLPAKIYEVHVRQGVDGPNTVPNLPASWAETPPPGTPMSVIGAPVLTLVNGSHPGASIAYLGDAARLPKMTPNYGQQLVFLSDCHNEQSRQDAEFLALYDGFVSQVAARFLGVPLVVLTQNPENGSPNVVAHAARRGNLLTYARAKRLDVIDTFKAFKDDSRGVPALLQDTVHPNAAGQQLWADTVTALYDATPA